MSTDVELAHHRDDLRVVRQPDRAQAQQARRRGRHRQLRDREGEGQLPRDRHTRRPWSPPSSRRGTARGCRRPPAVDRRVEPRRPAAAAAAGLGRADVARRGRWRWCRRWQFDYWQWLSLTLAAPGRGLGRLAVPPRRLGQPAPRHVDHGHPGLARHPRGARLVGLRPVPAARPGTPGMTHPFELTIERGRRRRQHLPRGRRGRDHVHPRRPLLRGALQAAGRGRAAGAAGARRQGRGGARADGGRRGADPDRPAGRRRHVRGPARARRSPPTARSRAARPRSTPSMLTGESVPVEVGAGDAVVGATVNVGGRLVVRATRVGADTQLAQMARLVEDAQNGKAEVQRLADRISGVFVPIVIALAVGHPRLLDRQRRRCGRGLHRRGGRADHRVPLRARPGDADRPHGRHRPRRPARHPHQGPRGAGVDPSGRHHRARQDRHRHDRPR